VSRYKPGDRVAVTVQRGRRTMQMSIVLGPPQVSTYRIEELTNAIGGSESVTSSVANWALN